MPVVLRESIQRKQKQKIDDPRNVADVMTAGSDYDDEIFISPGKLFTECTATYYIEDGTTQEESREVQAFMELIGYNENTPFGLIWEKTDEEVKATGEEDKNIRPMLENGTFSPDNKFVLLKDEDFDSTEHLESLTKSELNYDVCINTKKGNFKPAGPGKFIEYSISRSSLYRYASWTKDVEVQKLNDYCKGQESSRFLATFKEVLKRYGQISITIPNPQKPIIHLNGNRKIISQILDFEEFNSWMRMCNKTYKKAQGKGKHEGATCSCFKRSLPFDKIEVVEGEDLIGSNDLFSSDEVYVVPVKYIVDGLNWEKCPPGDTHTSDDKFDKWKDALANEKPAGEFLRLTEAQVQNMDVPLTSNVRLSVKGKVFKPSPKYPKIQFENVLIHLRRLFQLKGYPLSFEVKCEDTDEIDHDIQYAQKELKVHLRDPNTLRDYQMSALRCVFAGGVARSGIMLMPCGSGKTIVAIAAICTMKRSCLVLCHNTEGCAQWKREIQRYAEIPLECLAYYTHKGSNNQPFEVTNEIFDKTGNYIVDFDAPAPGTSYKSGDEIFLEVRQGQDLKLEYRRTLKLRNRSSAEQRLEELAAAEEGRTVDDDDLVVVSGKEFKLSKIFSRYYINNAKTIYFENIEQEYKSPKIAITTYQSMTMVTKDPKDQTRKIFIENVKRREWGIMILDEIHTATGSTFIKCQTEVTARFKIGLTASLIHERDPSPLPALEFIIGPILYEISPRILENTILPNNIAAIAKIKTVNIVCKMNEEFRLFKTQYINKCPLKTVWDMFEYTINCIHPEKIQICEFLCKFHQARNDKIIIFTHHECVTIILAKLIRHPYSKNIKNSGQTLYDTDSYLHSSNSDSNVSVLNRFRNGEILTMVLSQVGDIGIDVPDANVIIQMEWFGGSRSQEIQRMGRIQRSKSSAKMNDHGTFFYTIFSEDERDQIEQVRQKFARVVNPEWGRKFASDPAQIRFKEEEYESITKYFPSEFSHDREVKMMQLIEDEVTNYYIANKSLYRGS